MSVLSLETIYYRYEDSQKYVLNDLNATFEEGKFYAVVGKSGAGKSTFLSLLAGLDSPTKGKVCFNGQDIAQGSYSEHRRDHICLVFQNYNLIDYLTPLENVRLVNGKASKDILLKLGLDEELIHRNVLKLSGGQQQRVAIARALVSKAPIILADEPTGNLDEGTAAEIIDILKMAAHESGKCVIVVTHSPQVATASDEVLELEDGKLKKARGGK